MRLFGRHLPAAVAALTLVLSLARGDGSRTYSIDGPVLRTDVIGPNVGYTLTEPGEGRVLVGHDNVSYTDPNTGLVLVSMNGISIIDSHTGTVLSDTKLPNRFTLDQADVSAAPIFSQRANTVYWPLIMDPSGRSVVGLLDATTGRLRGYVLAGDTVEGLAVDDRSGHVFVAGLRLGELKCSCLSPSGQVIMLDAKSGRVLRKTLVGDDPTSVAIDSVRGRVFVTNSNSDDVSVLDSATGLLIRSVALPKIHVSHGQGVHPSLALADQATGRVFVLGEGNSSFSMFDTATGTLLNSAIVPQAHYLAAMAMDSLAGRVYIVDEPGGDTQGSIRMADARTGRFLQRLPAGTNPDRVLVDPTAGRLFVSTASSFQVGPAPDDQITVVSTRTGAILCTIALDVNQGVGGFVPLNGYLALDDAPQRLFAIAGNTIVILNAAFNAASCQG